MYKTALQILLGLSFVTVVLGLLFICSRILIAIFPVMLITTLILGCIYGLGVIKGNSRNRGCYNRKRRRF